MNAMQHVPKHVTLKIKDRWTVLKQTEEKDKAQIESEKNQNISKAKIKISYKKNNNNISWGLK